MKFRPTRPRRTKHLSGTARLWSLSKSRPAARGGPARSRSAASSIWSRFEPQAVEFGIGIRECSGVVRSRGACSNGCSRSGPPPRGARTLSHPSVAEQKPRRSNGRRPGRGGIYGRAARPRALLALALCSLAPAPVHPGPSAGILLGVSIANETSGINREYGFDGSERKATLNEQII
jgi:hypothetical protein